MFHGYVWLKDQDRPVVRKNLAEAHAATQKPPTSVMMNDCSPFPDRRVSQVATQSKRPGSSQCDAMIQHPQAGPVDFSPAPSISLSPCIKDLGDQMDTRWAH